MFGGTKKGISDARRVRGSHEKDRVSGEEFFIEDSHAPRISEWFVETGSPDLHCPQTDITIMFNQS